MSLSCRLFSGALKRQSGKTFRWASELAYIPDKDPPFSGNTWANWGMVRGYHCKQVMFLKRLCICIISQCEAINFGGMPHGH